MKFTDDQIKDMAQNVLLDMVGGRTDSEIDCLVALELMRLAQIGVRTESARCAVLFTAPDGRWTIRTASAGFDGWNCTTERVRIVPVGEG